MVAPSSAEWEQMIEIYSICTSVLFLKYFFSQLYASNMSYHPPEDAFLGPAKVPADIARRERAFANDLENIPFHMLLFWATFLVQCMANASGNGLHGTIALSAVIVVYTASRISHSVCYYFGIQPFRTISFLIGNCAVFVVIACLLEAGFECDVKKIFPGGN